MKPLEEGLEATPLGNYRIVNPDISLNDIKSGEQVVLIDNLRASSTIVTALALGIEKVIPLVKDEEAFKIKDDYVLTSGECGGIKLAGYDIGNSPVELESACKNAEYHTLIIKTTNLVPLLLKFPLAVICSSLNLASISGFLNNKKVCIIPAGGKYGKAEDMGVAFALAARLAGTDFNSEMVTCFTLESAAAKHLAEIGYEKDVEYIARTSIYDIVPLFDGEKIMRA